MPVEVFKKVVDENNTAVLKYTIKDPDGQTPSSFTSATLDCYNEKTGAIVDSLSGVNVLSNITGNVFRYTVPATANVIVDTTNSPEFEDHIVVVTIAFTAANGESHQGQFSFRITVQDNKFK